MLNLPILVGLDYHSNVIQVCVMGPKKKIYVNTSVENDPEAVFRVVCRFGSNVHIAIEACTRQDDCKVNNGGILNFAQSRRAAKELKCIININKFWLITFFIEVTGSSVLMARAEISGSFPYFCPLRSRMISSWMAVGTRLYLRNSILNVPCPCVMLRRFVA